MSDDLAAWLVAARHGVTAAARGGGAFAQHVLVLPTTRSTNDDVARAALEGAPEGYTVIAAEQTAGRGRRGTSWHSPAAHGLYLSTLLRPERWPAVRVDPTSPAASLVTLMAGVAVAETVRDVCQADVELKWPNDVMVRVPARRPAPAAPSTGPAGADLAAQADAPAWRKLAGILAEGASEGGVLRSVVLGIGINVRRSAAPPAVARRMIALQDLDRARQADAAAIVAALLRRLCEGHARLLRGELAEVRDAWRRWAPSVDGSRVRWHHQGVESAGRALGIDDVGALQVQMDDGRNVTVHGGDVAWWLDPHED